MSNFFRMPDLRSLQENLMSPLDFMLNWSALLDVVHFKSWISECVHHESAEILTVQRI